MKGSVNGKVRQYTVNRDSSSGLSSSAEYYATGFSTVFYWFFSSITGFWLLTRNCVLCTLFAHPQRVKDEKLSIHHVKLLSVSFHQQYRTTFVSALYVHDIWWVPIERGRLRSVGNWVHKRHRGHHSRLNKYLIRATAVVLLGTICGSIGYYAVKKIQERRNVTSAVQTISNFNAVELADGECRDGFIEERYAPHLSLYLQVLTDHMIN
jgi:hypothetical protein